jgi:DNA mismatch endonuclease (patch repair protein)
MAAIRSKNTKPELALRGMLRDAGAIGYRIHAREIPGKPDVAFTRWRVAVFVDGAFWHGHPDYFEPANATTYWREKIARTQQRDRVADAALSSLGWQVVRFWDFDLAADPTTCLENILAALRGSGWPGPASCRPR